MSTHAPLLFGKYKLLELIARGGMAEVFKAKSYGVEGFEKLVVIKRILPDLAQNPGFVEMFINEAKLSVALSHANIVQVFDLGREEDTYFIAMEYVHGMDFGDALRRCRRAGTRAPIEMCVYIASEMARALDYAHRRRDAQMRPLGIVHRDVSPQNVLLSYEGEVKVTDFGIAKARKTIDEAGTIKGKYAYMAPEQARGLDVDARADIYALGVVLYEALAGRNPFQAPTPYETLRRVQAGEKLPLNQANADVPDELARIVDRALEPDRDKRYPSAARMYEDLAGFLFTTGKRVAGHDLAEWLQALRDGSAREDDVHRVRDALEDIEPSATKTPVEVPASANYVSRPGTTGGITRPHIERRDVTLMAVEVLTPAAPGATAFARFEPLLPMVTRYGGVTLDHNDESIVLIFGAQDPDGRDTETALRCALKLQQAAARASIEIGIGVHPARVHVNVEGEPERDERLTSAVALARDLGRAAGSRILASEPVGRLAGEIFNMVQLAGRVQSLERVPGTPLQVLGERAPHEGAHRKFVGRKDSFRKIGEVLARATKRGSTTVAIVGEAGTGKTRFLQEIHYRLRRMNHPVSWYQAASLPHERDVPMSAMLAMLRTILGIDETDPEAVVKERAQRLRELGLTADEMRAVSVVLGAGERTDAVANASRALRGAVVRIATRLAQDQLTVLVWDAAENMDDESQALVHEIVRGAGRARVVVIVAFRPGFVHSWNDSVGIEEITFGPLDEEEARQLVALRLGVPREASLPADLCDDLWSKGAGNPLYIEEYLKTLCESGAVEVREGAVLYRRDVAEVGVPKTLRGLVASRIARLSPAQRGVLQVASIVGPRFFRDVVAEVGELARSTLDAALGSLEERGIVVRTSGDEYVFAHELLREVVYEGLPLETRRQLHAAVATVTERLFADRLDEMAERLAYYYRESNDRAKAVEYLVRAAQRQSTEQAYGAATVNFARAVELVLSSPRPEPARVIELCTDLGIAAIRGRQTAIGIEKLKLGLWYAEELGERAATVRMLILLGRLLALGNHIVDAVAHLERARALLDAESERETYAEVIQAIGDTFARNGDFKRAQQYLAEAARLAGERGDCRDAAMALLSVAKCQAAAGERERALETCERARDLVAESDDPVMRTELSKTLGLVHFQTRDFQNAAICSEQATELAREYGLAYEVAVNAHNAGDAYLRLGDYKRAFTWLKASLDTAQEHGFEKLTKVNSLFLAFIDATKFGSGEARAQIESVLSYAQSQGYTWDVLQAKFLLGVRAKEQGDLEQARRLLREALALANETDNRMFAEDCEILLRDIATIPPGPPTIVPQS